MAFESLSIVADIVAGRLELIEARTTMCDLLLLCDFALERGLGLSTPPVVPNSTQVSAECYVVIEVHEVGGGVEPLVGLSADLVERTVVALKLGDEAKPLQVFCLNASQHLCRVPIE